MTTECFVVACIASLLAASGAIAQTPCEERVASDCFYSGIYPFNAITQLFVEQDDGELNAYGTGFLVSQHCALTNGHCVYKRGEQHFFYKDIWMMPGACRSASGLSFNLFGIREALIKGTNTKWTDLSYDWETEVDYGSLRFVCPFEELTTFLPLCFDVSPSSVHMAGYPLQEIPDTGDLFNQWIAYGDIITQWSRVLRYEAHSTGGASGSPVWRWRSGQSLLEVIGFNSTHWDSCDGGGPRLVAQNMDLIRSWMQWEPSAAQRSAAGCPPIPGLSLAGLIGFFEANPGKLLDAQGLGIVDPIAPPPTGPSRRIMQVIERGFYEWVEFDLQPGTAGSPRLMQLLKAPGVDLSGTPWIPGTAFNPQSAQQGWVSASKARALLSGSAGRASPPVMGVRKRIVDAQAIALVQPAPGTPPTGNPNPTPDVPTGVGSAFCAADFDGDGLVAGGDMAIMLGSWGPCQGPCVADLDEDLVISGGDLALLIAAWGPCAP